jgi:hypothetical protein
MTHTPGPWEANGSFVQLPRHNHETICRVGYPFPCGTSSEVRSASEVLYANAKLIAAAPNLLAACEQALALLGTDEESANGCGDPIEVAHDLRQAIRKAKGEHA